MFAFKMESRLFVLIFLSLVLSSSQQSEMKLLSGPLTRNGAGAVKLQCITKYLDHGVYWFRQATTMAPPRFLVHLNAASKPKPADETKPNHFKPSKDSSSFILEINNFNEDDQGTYLCLVYRNSEIHFSTGIHLYYPPDATLPPTSTTAQIVTVNGICHCQTHPPTEPTKEDGLDFSCSLYVWIPLAALDLLLLVVFLVTCSLLCKIYIRRKRCKHHCRNRPMNVNNSGPSVPKRYK